MKRRENIYNILDPYTHRVTEVDKISLTSSDPVNGRTTPRSLKDLWNSDNFHLQRSAPITYTGFLQNKIEIVYICSLSIYLYIYLFETKK